MKRFTVTLRMDFYDIPDAEAAAQLFVECVTGGRFEDSILTIAEVDPEGIKKDVITLHDPVDFL